MQNLVAVTAVHNELKRRLKEEYELDDEDQALADTLEGISDLDEAIAMAAREARYEEAQAEAIKSVISDMMARKHRRDEKAAKLRRLIAWAMSETGKKKIDAPDATISLRGSKPKLVCRSQPEDMKGTAFVKEKVSYSWDRDAIAKAYEAGDETARSIAHYDNPEPSIAILTR